MGQTGSLPGYGDAVDSLTGESLLPDGSVPPRPTNLAAMSYRELADGYLWAEISKIRPVAVIAVKHEKEARGVFRGRTLLGDGDLQRARRQIQELPGARILEEDEEFHSPVMLDGKAYPALHVELYEQSTLSRLRSLAVVDYVEPLLVELPIGCSLPDYARNPADEKFSPAPGQQQADWVSWNFRHLGIPDSWKLFNNGRGVIAAPGKDVTIGVIDTGLYPDAPQFDDQTFQLPPGTRSPARRLSSIADPTVNCSHGTRIAGVATAPAAGRPKYGANYVGVAWGADLVAVKVGDGVVHTAATVNAIVAGMDMAIAAGARILTLAFGMVYESDYLRDNIVRIFDDQSRPSVLMIAAAGTIVPWVVFPATMERETVAVTVVDFVPGAVPRYRKYRGLAYPIEDIVAYGQAVDFAAVDGDGDIPTQGNSTTPLTSLGASSMGTALVAGIAAVAWSRIPELSRADLLARLAVSSSLSGIEGEDGLAGRSTDVGWGIPDAYVAAGGARHAAVQGPRAVAPASSYQLTATVDGYQPFFTYQWDSGERTQILECTAGPQGSVREHSVAIRNIHDGSVLQAAITVAVTRVHLRMIYSEELISEWATFFNGARVNRLVNVGYELPVGCSVVWARGLQYVETPGGLTPSGAVAETVDNGNNGFTVTRIDGAGPAALDAIAHVWHDGLSGIRLRVAYQIWEPDGVDAVQPGITRGAP